MKFQQHYSSSAGNLYTVTNDHGQRLLIECGVTWDKLRKALDYDLTNIEGCLLSHEHKDHSKSAVRVIRAGINLYSSKETMAELALYEFRRAFEINCIYWYYTGTFDVFSFRTHHDAAGSLGFVVRTNNEYLLFATDTSHLKQHFKIPFTIIALECSYDKNILQNRIENGSINPALAKRLLTSHMEKHRLIKYIDDYIDLSQCQEIHLLHMSESNIDKEQTRKEFEDRFFIKTVVKGK